METVLAPRFHELVTCALGQLRAATSKEGYLDLLLALFRAISVSSPCSALIARHCLFEPGQLRQHILQGGLSTSAPCALPRHFRGHSSWHSDMSLWEAARTKIPNLWLCSGSAATVMCLLESGH